MFKGVCLFAIAIPLGVLSIREGNFNNVQPSNYRDNTARHTQPIRYVEPDGPRAPPSAILSHKQGLTNEGVFNYVFAADNGLKQGESIAPDGTRTGAYEYIDPSGKTIFVKYTAGKDGFKILEGDHIPLQPQAYKPDPQYQPEEYKQGNRDSDDGKYRAESENYQQEPQYNQPQAKQYQPKLQPAQQYRQPNPNPQSQRYITQQKQQHLFQPNQQQKGLGSYAGQPLQKPMLFNVEQRHSVNYRKYTDNGQAVGGEYDGNPSAESAPHAYGSGYNFEFKG